MVDNLESIFKLEFNKESELLDFNSDDISYNCAIQSIYKLDEDVYIYWNNEKIEISLKYDIGDSWLDIIGMLKNLNNEDIKKFNMEWPSSSFFAYWEFTQIDKSNIKIETNWDYKTDKYIIVPRKYFIEEWERLIEKIKKDLVNQGYDLKKLKNSG